MTRKSLLALAILFGISLSCGRQQKELVVVSFGGSFQDAQRQAFFKPFETETGIRIREVSYDGSYEKVKAQVRSKTVNWDVVDVESAVFARGVRDSLFVRIPDWVGEGVRFAPGALRKHGIGADVYATLIGFRLDGRVKPETWAQFFDVHSFPGPRSLRRNPRGTLEAALLADGVPGDSLYPLDVNRALRVLDGIKDDIRVWWTSGQQPVDLLSKGTVVASSAWSGRVWAARRAGLPIGASFEQALVEPEFWVVLRGSKHTQEAFRFLRSTLKPDRQAKMAELFGVAPANLEAMKSIRPETARYLPTSPQNISRIVVFNPDWWAEHEDEVQSQWERWLSE